MITVEEGTTTVTTYSGASQRVPVYTVYWHDRLVIRTTSRRAARRVIRAYTEGRGAAWRGSVEG